jgi:hypothetical protein
MSDAERRGGHSGQMPDLVRIGLPGVGSGFTLRHRTPWGLEHVEFLGAEGRVWLFRTVSDLRDFLVSAGPVAPRWRGCVPSGGRELDHLRVERYKLWEMIDGTLRWGPGEEAAPCSELCVELAFYCESEQLLDALGPPSYAYELHVCTDVRKWRRIIPLIGSVVRFWGEEERTYQSLRGSLEQCGIQHPI